MIGVVVIVEIKSNYTLTTAEFRNQRWSPSQSFLHGLKPACFENITRLPQETAQHLELFPNIEIAHNQKIYFQTTKQKQYFLQKASLLQEDSPEAYALIGTTLGYPPKAVSFYKKHLERFKVDENQEREHYQQIRVGINYAGIQFAGHIKNLEDNITWLWGTYKSTMPVWIILTWLEKNIAIDFRIRYENRNELDQVEQLAKAVLTSNEQWISNQKAGVPW